MSASPAAPINPGRSLAPFSVAAVFGLLFILFPANKALAMSPLVLPLYAAALLGMYGSGLKGRGAGWTAFAAAFLSFVAAVGLFITLNQQADGETAKTLAVPFYSWIGVGDLSLNFGVWLDPLSSTWSLFVTGIGSLIFLYSISYMHGDPSYSRYFCYLSLFLFSMMILVLGQNLVLTFLGWEGVGLCSYLLIGFEYQKDSAAAAGKKAFIVNRIGDVGFLLAMFWSFKTFGTLEFGDSEGVSGLLSQLNAIDAVPPMLALLFFLGAVGKSAQAPLFVWLPDAMAGPTPVSALIHAATMVTAGIYLLCRLSNLFMAAGWALTVVAWTGVLTALLAGLIALRQNDIKRVLAYSTISQLGYMFLACGVGAFGAAIFHVVTHAFFKALLFLGSGAVIHGLGGEQDLRKMGGLKEFMPRTYRSMQFGALALAGIPPLAGFFSKDEILASVFGGHHYALWILGVITAALTAFYTSRMITLCFLGPSRIEPGVQPHEAPPLMATALSVLKWLSALGGLALGIELLGWLPLHHFVEDSIAPTPVHVGKFTLVILMLLAIAIAVFFWRLGKRWYLGDGQQLSQIELTAPRFSQAILNRFGVDEFYDRVVVNPLRQLAAVCSKLDLGVVDGFYNFMGHGVIFMGNTVRFLQTGVVHAYVLWFLVGAAVVLALTVGG